MSKKDRNKPQYEWIEVAAGEAYYSLGGSCLESSYELSGRPEFYLDGFYCPILIKIRPRKSFKVFARKIKDGYFWRSWSRRYIKLNYDIKMKENEFLGWC